MLKAVTRLLVPAAVALLAFAPASLRADDTQTNEPASLSDSVGDGLAKLKPLLDAKDWNGAVRVVNDLMKDAAADSYDEAFLLETKAKIMTMGNNYVEAIVPLETSLAISDRHHYYTKQQTLDMLYFLSQLYFQQAEGAKVDHATQIGYYEKAVSAIRRWIAMAPKLTADISEYYARLLYSEAVAKDASHPDAELMKQASDQLEKTIRLTARPKENTYVFWLATIQQQQDYARCAELIEFILAKNPKNKSLWEELSTFYIVLAQNNDKDPKKMRELNIRALNTIERAQALGYLTKPIDNYRRFTLYYELGQFGTAAEVLHEGLKTNTIDSDLDKWILLSSSYQQVNRDFDAIEVLKEAEGRFPENADIDLKIASAYAQLEKGADALKYYILAATKDEAAQQPGHNPKNRLSKSQRSYMLLAWAYQAYELQKYEDAKNAVDRAIEAAPDKSDHQLRGLKNAIEDALRQHEAAIKPKDI